MSAVFFVLGIAVGLLGLAIVIAIVGSSMEKHKKAYDDGYNKGYNDGILKSYYTKKCYCSEEGC